MRYLGGVHFSHMALSMSSWSSEERKCAGACPRRALIPFVRVEPSWVNQFPMVPLVNTITLRNGFQHTHFGVTQTSIPQQLPSAKGLLCFWLCANSFPRIIPFDLCGYIDILCVQETWLRSGVVKQLVPVSQPVSVRSDILRLSGFR